MLIQSNVVLVGLLSLDELAAGRAILLLMFNKKFGSSFCMILDMYLFVFSVITNTSILQPPKFNSAKLQLPFFQAKQTCQNEVCNCHMRFASHMYVYTIL